MARPVTLFTGQWADLPLEELAKKAAGWGYDGLELACWGDHMDVDKAATDEKYCEKQLGILKKNNLKVFCDKSPPGRPVGLRPQRRLSLRWVCPCQLRHPQSSRPLHAEKKRKWAVETMKNTARAARNLGLTVVNGFTGSSIWHMLYSFPPVTDAMIEDGFAYFAKMWNPILDVFDECGVKFALEVHPTEIAFDIITAKRALGAIGNRPAFGFNFDPSHLHWQMVDPVCFLKEFSDRIYHVHMKDAAVQLNGRSGILGSHLNFGQPGRGWDFRSLGHGGVNFEEIIRTLNQIGYNGPLSVEWEDSGMDREHGAKEACEFVKRIDFKPSQVAFDAAFEK